MSDESSFRTRIREACERIRDHLSDPKYKAWREEREREIERDQVAQLRYVWKTRGIPAAFLPFIEAPEETASLKAVRRFLAGLWQDPERTGSSPLALLMAGDVGRGKSIAGAWAVAQEPDTLFIEAMDLIQTSGFSDGRRMMQFLQRIDLLVIDELGNEPLDEAGWGESKFYDLLNGRLQNNRRTILVTNLDAQAFVARYPDVRLRDRLRAHSDVFVAVGPSLRGT